MTGWIARVERHLEDPLAEEFHKGTMHDGEPVQFNLKDDKMVFSQ
jgi:ATP-dependent Clp protease ATP-binding subunit ClpA